jgi:glucosamine kinase
MLRQWCRQGIWVIIFDMHVVLGVDAGGTSCRAALFTPEGSLVRRGNAGGANPGTLGMERAAAQLTAAVRSTLTGIDVSQVRAVVAGIAGEPEQCAALMGQVFGRLLAGAGETVPVRTVGDIVTAFASGTAEPSGSVLISGTGAIAAKIIDREKVATADGFGWLLGDEGSAFWLGRAAARATIRALAATPAPPDGLVALVARQLAPEGLGGDPVARLAAAVHAQPPLALAELAPLVSRAAAEGDPAAAVIVSEAAGHLVTTLRSVHESGPVVLAGSVLTSAGPVREAVTELLLKSGTSAVTAGDAAGAAAWLAARPFLGPREAEARHPRFVHTP